MNSGTRENLCLGFASLAEDDVNANRFEINAAVAFQINGRLYTKAATANLQFSAGHTALAAKEMCAFFVCLDVNGNVTTIQSPIVKNNQEAGYVPGAWEWPNPSDRAVIGAIVVDCRNAATFTPNTTDLGAADVTDTYVHVGIDYGRPIAY